MKICIFKGIDQLYRETVNIKMSVNRNTYFCKILFIEKMALGLCISFIDLSTSRNNEQTPLVNSFLLVKAVSLSSKF